MLVEPGRSAERLLTLAQTDGVKAKLADNTAAAGDRGGFGAPTFFVDDEMFFGKERLDQIERLLTYPACAGQENGGPTRPQ